MLRLAAAAAAALMLLPFTAQAQDVPAAPVMSGDVRIHDPSVIVENGHWVSFQTGAEGFWRGAILLKTSPDGIEWKNAGGIGKGLPAWPETELGYRSQLIWAPSVSKYGDTIYLYYSVSSFGINASAIGLMTNSAFDPLKPDQGWEDQGLVLKSGVKDDFNAIDPFRIDIAEGRAWLAYGSFWSGIKMRELDPTTGKLIAPDAPVHGIASRNGGAIEAPAILVHDGKFYLFVSFDQCCRGVDSTYRIMVGRADAVTGPYLDRAGLDLMQGGGTEVQSGRGRYLGPGGQEPVFGAEDLLVYHYYDADERGMSKLQIAPIGWTEDGWPQLAAPPQ
ncbi:MAG: arabinan endo-1,5-alpha-L-arabinosidase [Devosia sp.]